MPAFSVTVGFHEELPRVVVVQARVPCLHLLVPVLGLQENLQESVPIQQKGQQSRTHVPSVITLHVLGVFVQQLFTEHIIRTCTQVTVTSLLEVLDLLGVNSSPCTPTTVPGMFCKLSEFPLGDSPTSILPTPILTTFAPLGHKSALPPLSHVRHQVELSPLPISSSALHHRLLLFFFPFFMLASQPPCLTSSRNTRISVGVVFELKPLRLHGPSPS